MGKAKRFEAALAETKDALDKVNTIRLNLALGEEHDLITARVKAGQVFNHLVSVARTLHKELFGKKKRKSKPESKAKSKSKPKAQPLPLTEAHTHEDTFVGIKFKTPPSIAT